MDDKDRQAWITDLKRKYGLRCIGDEEERPSRLPEWPVLDYVPGGTTYTCIAEYGLVWDGVHWYEKPEGMPMSEFLSSLR